MKKIILLLPVYNDWESLTKVLDEVNSIIQKIKNYEFSCLIVNDCSSVENPKIIKPKNFNSLKIVNMKKNKGHARCNAFGLRYINLNEKYDYVIVMDSDGEDRPVEINSLIKKISEEPATSVVANLPFLSRIEFAWAIVNLVSSMAERYSILSCTTPSFTFLYGLSINPYLFILE